MQFCNEQPAQKDTILRYISSVDDDTFYWPLELNVKNADKITFENGLCFNHSCEPNTIFFETEDEILMIYAFKDITIGEEITYDYQCIELETSFYREMQCKCGSLKCRGILKLNDYRNVDWQTENYENCSNYVKKRIDELKTKWFSTKCYLKFYKDEKNRVLALTSLEKIKKDELVAVFADDNKIGPAHHYIRYSRNPTCYLVENEVFVSKDVEANTELTLEF